MGFAPRRPDVGKQEDLEITTAAYGATLNYGKGTNRYDDTVCIFADPLREVKIKRRSKGGKYTEYTYYGTWAVAVCDHEIEKITRIWFDRKLVYDITNSGPITPITSRTGSGKHVGTGTGDLNTYARFYLGTETQDPDPRMEAILDERIGVGSAPAYRGVAYIFFDDVPLYAFGNHLPAVSVETVTAANDTYPYEKIDTPVDQPSRLWGMAYSSDYSRLIYGLNGDYTIIDVAARAVMISGSFPSPVYNTQRTFGIDRVGRIYAAGDEEVVGGDIHVFSADGLFEISTISAAGLTLGGAACVVKALDSESAEFLGVYTQFPSTQTAYTNLLTSTLIVVETDDFTPTGILTTGFFVDSTSGAFWGAGAKHDLVITTTIAYLFPLSDGGAPGAGMITVTGLSAKAEPTVQAFMVGDNYLMTWGEELHLLDPAGAILASQTGLALDPYNLPKQVENLKPGVTSLWVNPTSGTTALEISLVDLSILRTETMTNWSADDVDGLIYDPINNALITAPQTDDELAWRYLDRAVGTGVQLSDIVDDVSERSGFQSGDWDATDLDQTVLGYAWTQGKGAEILKTLLEVHDSEVGPHNFSIRFRKRGAAVLGTLATADLAGTPRYSVEEPHDDDLPVIASLSFADPAIDGQNNTARDRRPLSTSDGRKEEALSLPTWRSDVTTARRAIVGWMRRRWFSSETVEAGSTRKHTAWEPGDAYTLVLDDISRSMKITRLEFGGNGILRANWERYDPDIHIASALGGASADGVPPAVIDIPSYTKGIVLDVPLIRDADDGLIVYLAAAPYAPTLGWLGAEFYVSDDGVDYEPDFGSVDNTEEAVIGTTGSVLPDALTTVIDMASVLTVKVLGGVLTSCTQAQMLNGENRALVGDEVLGFTTATLTAPKTYQLSGLLRGRRGTEWATSTHATAERFVLLETVLPKVTMGASEVGDTDYYEAITSGRSSGFIQQLEFEGRSLKPYSPAHLTAVEIGGDTVLSWVRRTRIGGDNVYGSTPPLGETSEAYEVDILDVSDAVVRTIAGLTSPTATYSSAQKTADSNAGARALAYPISSVVGRGYPASVSI